MMQLLLLVVTTTVALLSGPTFAAPSDYHHLAYVGLRHHESPPAYTTREEDSVPSRRDDELPLPSEDQDKVPEEEQQSEDEGPRSLTTSGSSARQAPYSYYYIGRKLWYVPLYFSLYFVIYVGALIIRAIARHKVTFPERLPTARDLGSEHLEGARLDRASVHVNSILDDMVLKYM